jgi:excisionase family DNA binding protein
MLLATKQAAERLGVHPATIRRWAASGRVRYERIGRERAIPVEEVSRLQRERSRKVARQPRAFGDRAVADVEAAES